MSYARVELNGFDRACEALNRPESRLYYYLSRSVRGHGENSGQDLSKSSETSAIGCFLRII